MRCGRPPAYLRRYLHFNLLISITWSEGLTVNRNYYDHATCIIQLLRSESFEWGQHSAGRPNVPKNNPVLSTSSRVDYVVELHGDSRISVLEDDWFMYAIGERHLVTLALLNISKPATLLNIKNKVGE